MDNTIRDEIFGEITFDGLCWIKTEPVRVTVSDRTFELRTEIGSVDLVYDWKRIGKLNKEVADMIFDPSLGGLSYTLSRMEEQKALYSEVILNSDVGHLISGTVIRSFSGSNETASLREEKLGSLELSVIRVYTGRIEVGFSSDRYEKGLGCFVIKKDGEISIRPLDPEIEKLKDELRKLGFEIKEGEQRYFYACDREIPSAEKVRGMLDLLTDNEEMLFWNYYHRGGVEPGSYIYVRFAEGKPYVREATHGCSGSTKTVDMDVLAEFIIRNWDKDMDWGKYDHQVAIGPTNPKYLLDEISRIKIGTFIPDYSATPG